MSSPQKMPAWLSKAMRSDKHITDVLHILALRESQRVKARRASTALLDRKNDEVVTSKLSVFPKFLHNKSSGKQDLQDGCVQHYSTISGTLKATMNRYIDILPYDRTLVTFSDTSEGLNIGSEANKRYLNANWIVEKYGHKWWIATQAPLPSTAHAFLSLILQPITRPTHVTSISSDATSPARVRTVVQLTRNTESGRRKADAYFPTAVGQSVNIYPEMGCNAPTLRVTLLDSKSIKEAHCIQSTVSITPLHPSSQLEHGREHLQNGADNYGNLHDDEKISFNHLLYTSWPDHGVPDPEDRESLLNFIHLVDSLNRDKSYCPKHTNPTPDHPCTELHPDPPVMIGCSAGVGRTGSFIAISSLLRHYGFLPSAQSVVAPEIHPSPLGNVPENLKDDLVLQEIDSLREQRPGMVQKNVQAVLVYEVLADMFSDT